MPVGAAADGQNLGAVAGQKLVLLMVKSWCCCWSKAGAAASQNLGAVAGQNLVLLLVKIWSMFLLISFLYSSFLFIVI